MVDIYNDQRIVMTLDAGGTNFVFSAIQAGEEIVKPINKDAIVSHKEKSLRQIIRGFEEMESQLSSPPAAISFAFPGPANYPEGIIYNVGNLPAFSGGVALGPMLQNYFKLPVFINNDADLFTYGEAIAGILPVINQELQNNNSSKKYTNLLGITIGTGLGGGLIIDGKLNRGDNSVAGEIWLTSNNYNISQTVEEGVSIRAVCQSYKAQTGHSRSPKQIYNIALGRETGDQFAALETFDRMGQILGETLANAINLIDGAIVIGGGVSGAWDLFMPSVMKQLNGTIQGRNNQLLKRISSKAYNLADKREAETFYQFKKEVMDVPFSNKKVSASAKKRLPICQSRLGTSQATALGAYAFAVKNI